MIYSRHDKSRNSLKQEFANFFSEHGTFYEILFRIGHPKALLALDGIYENIKRQNLTQEQIKNVLIYIQNYLIKIKEQYQARQITPVQLEYKLLELSDHGSSFYQKILEQANTYSVNYLSKNNVVNFASHQWLNLMREGMPEEERTDAYTKVGQENSNPAMYYDPSGNYQYSQSVHLNQPEQGVYFMYDENGISPNLIFASLYAKLKQAVAANQPFAIHFQNPSDEFAISFLHSLTSLFGSFPNECAKYIGEFKINDMIIDINRSVSCADKTSYWFQLKSWQTNNQYFYSAANQNTA